MGKYSSYEKYTNFINKYKKAKNASSGSEVDSNANVDNKNIATMQNELPKKDLIGTNRLLMINKLSEMYGDEIAESYIDDLESHRIYKHDETSVMPYTYAAQEVVNVKYNGHLYTVSLERLYEICNEPESLVDDENDVWIKYPNEMLIEDRAGFTKVERLVRKRRHRDLVRVKAAFSNDIVVTDNHPLIVSDNIDLTVPAIESLGEKQYRCSSKISFGNIDAVKSLDLFAEGKMSYIELENGFLAHTGNNALWYAYPKRIDIDREIGYFVGFFIGDGGYNTSNGSIEIYQNESCVLCRIADTVMTHFNSPSALSYSIKDERYKLVISNPLVYVFLRNYLGIKPKAQFKTLPERIFEFNKEFSIGIIEGLIDSDGTVGGNGEYSIRLASRTAILQIAAIVNAMGITTGCSTQQTKFGCNEKVSQKYQLFGVNFRDTLDLIFGHSIKSVKARPITKGQKGSFDEWQSITGVSPIDNEPFLDANEYIYDVTTESHSFVCNGIWVHNCVSVTMYPFLSEGLRSVGGISGPPKHLDSFCGEFINFVFAIAAQFAGAVSTPEYLTYLDYFIRKEYGGDYYQHTDRTVSFGNHPRTIDNVITDKFEQVAHSINQPAAARGYQSVFWNCAYFDKYYFDGIFHNFLFPDDTEPQWESVSWLQKRHMKWFNAERLKNPLTYPVETMNLLNNGTDYVDQEWFDFASEMYAEGHSFFTYTSNSVDSLASCCYSGDTKVLIKNENGAHLIPFKDVEKINKTKNGYRVFNNGKWSQAKLIKLPARKMYEVTTATNKKMFVTDNHRNNCLGGMKITSDLTTDDYIMCSTAVLDTYPEKDEHLTYEMGFAVGAFLGDGSFGSNVQLSNGEKRIYDINYSISEPKKWIIDIINKANMQLGGIGQCVINHSSESLIPVRISSKDLVNFIIRWTNWKRGVHASTKELNMDCVLQSIEFREGIVDGWYATDGNMNSIKPGYSLRGYSTSQKLVECIEAVCTTLGYVTSMGIDTRTEKPIFGGTEFDKNYPVYSLLKFAKNKQAKYHKDVCIFRDNSTYVKIKSIREFTYEDEFVYCFEMADCNDDKFTLPNGIHNYNCRLRNALQDNTFSFTLGAGGVATGSKGVITININRLVQNAVRDSIDISDAVKIQVERVHKYLLAFNEIMKDNFKAGLLPIYNAGFISLEKQYLTCGVNGFVEGAEFLGIPITPNEQYFEYCEKILKPIYESNRAARTDEVMFNTEFVPAENLGVKNAKWDKEDGYFVPRECYNSYFYLVEDESTSLVDKFILHGSKLTKYLDGGSALHGNLNEHLSQIQYKQIMLDAVKTGCSYFTFNVPNTICNDCGYITKHRRDHCEKCGSKNIDYLTRIIGYLKRVSAFSETRQKEEAKRYYE